MNRRQVLKAIGATVACPICAALGGGASAALAAEGAHWSYEGAEGPDGWGALTPENGVCTLGKEQSPVNLMDPVAAEIGSIATEYRAQPLRIINNGHTIQVNRQHGDRIYLSGRRYDLLQIHFHTPSEHAIDGRRLDMEAHFVHRAPGTGELAVLGVFIMKGREHPAIEMLWRSMPLQAGPEVYVDQSLFDPSNLLPPSRRYWRYQGSLTTPPCSETVNWTVLKTPIEASEAQIKRFASLFPMNARPIQPLNRRYLLEGGV